jgi:hypothetical protein
MGSIHPHVERGRETAERAALRLGLLVTSSPGQPLRPALNRSAHPTRCCATCAGSVEFGAVLSGGEVYCSVECSVGDRRA